MKDFEIWHARVPNVLNGSKQLFASTYLTYLPSEAELLREIDIQKAFYLHQHPEAR